MINCMFWETGCQVNWGDVSGWFQAIASVSAIFWAGYSAKKQSTSQYETAMQQVKTQHENGINLMYMQQRHDSEQTARIAQQAFELEEYRSHKISWHRLSVVLAILSKIEVIFNEISSEFDKETWGGKNGTPTRLESSIKEIKMLPLFEIPDPELIISLSSLPDYLYDLKKQWEAEEDYLFMKVSGPNKYKPTPAQSAKRLRDKYLVAKETQREASNRCRICMVEVKKQLSAHPLATS